MHVRSSFFAFLGPAVACFVTLSLAVRGVAPGWVVAILAPVTFLSTVAGLFRLGVALGPLATDEHGEARPLHRRHGFGVVALGVLLGLPALGAFSLVDPWETHYAEVAREMIERGDFISPWWGHEGWFMSKPVLVFWLEALSMKIFGAETLPDRVLDGAGDFIAHPEWAVRLPAFLFAIGGMYALYYGVSRTCGRRAGFLGALVLATCSGFALLSHQALTDMPLVASVGASLGMLLCALSTDDAIRVTRYEIRLGGRTLSLHAGHALASLLLLFVVPQLLMLLARHVHVGAGGIHVGIDHLMQGSPHACVLPGQPACKEIAVAHPRIQPATQVALWVPLVIFVTSHIAEETRKARLFAIAAWVFASIAAMAKGPEGLVLPAAAALIEIARRRELRLFLRMEVLAGLAATLVLVGPWYLAMFARHGHGFIAELVGRHMWSRAFDHLHDTNAGEDTGILYFVRQLGFAMFPWSGLAAISALLLLFGSRDAPRATAKTVFLAAGFLGFALISAMKTKFHHYVLVVVPPVAMLVGQWLDEQLLEKEVPRTRWRLVGMTIVHWSALVAAVVLLGMVTRALASPAYDALASGAAHLMHLVTYRYSRLWPASNTLSPALIAFGGVAAFATLGLGFRRWQRPASVALAGVAVLFGVFLLDVYLVRCAPNGGQRGVFEAYYRDRGTAASPLVAYQLNWKGENYYTGNDLAIFVSSGAPLRRFLDDRRRTGERTVYFVTERGRVDRLRSEVGVVRAFETLTSTDVSAEFCLVRADLGG